MLPPLYDNNMGQRPESIPVFHRDSISGLFALGDKSIRSLTEENEGVLVYPYCIRDSRDGIGDQVIFNVANAGDIDHVRLMTGNIMGFLGKGGQTIKIGSRFDKGRNDFLMHYMLQKVFFPNIFDLPHGSEDDGMFDLLMFMFPHFLKEAIRQGIYREYRRFEHNDSSIRGAIDIGAHVRKNIPFTGNVAYTSREHTFDNDIMQLVRHTVEYMKTRHYGDAILHMDRDTADCVDQVCHMTSSYRKADRMKVIQKNLRPMVHPFYTEYRPLQQLCLQILRHDEIRFGDTSQEVCGILFDGAWLWEEYVNTILAELDFDHPRNKERTGAIYLFKDTVNGRVRRSGQRFLDFYKDGFVLDAKYKRLFMSDEGRNRVSMVGRDDLHQVITYMYYYRAKKGGFICPFDHDFDTRTITSSLEGYGGEISVFGIRISKEMNDFEKFSREMMEEESRFRDQIKHCAM
ncbi:MAG: McrC family protein [Bacteroidales bacterium]|nr:McrC family protein [Bacteroidales bacterium]